jgi:hypothetical protein
LEPVADAVLSSPLCLVARQTPLNGYPPPHRGVAGEKEGVNGAPGPPRSACRGQLLGYRLQSLRGNSCCSLRSLGISFVPRPRGGETDLIPVVSSCTGRARAGVRASRLRARVWRRPRPGSTMEERPRREDVQPDQGHCRRAFAWRQSRSR